MRTLKFLHQYFQAHKPLGWAQLSHQKVRLAVALMGVAFSNILIFTQLGLRALLFDGITLLPDSLKGDLFLVSTYAPTIDWGGFPLIYLYQADAIAGVASASPLYISSAEWVNPEELSVPGENSGKRRTFTLFPNRVKILAFNPVQPVLNIPEITPYLDHLSAPDSILFDRLSQDKLGPVVDLFAQQGGVTTVMDNQRVYVVGLFNLGSTVFDNGHVIMSDWNYARRVGGKWLQTVSVGCLTLEPGADLEAVRSQLQARLSDNVRILTREEINQAEKAFQESFPNGKILNFGALMGFVVGVIVVYQVLYTDVSDHLPEYATLKAMGYSDTSLLMVVMQEAIILAILGFIPGYLASYGIYNLLMQLTNIPLTMRTTVALQVFLLTVFMCILSGAIAMNRLRSADPADIF